MIIQALVALSEHTPDPFYKAGLSLLSEFAAILPNHVVRSSGIRTLCSQIARLPAQSVQDSTVFSLLYLLNAGETRPLVSVKDLRLLFAPLTQIYGTIDPKERTTILQGVEASHRIFILFFRSWAGLITMFSDPLGLQSVINALSMQTIEVSSIILDSIFTIFRIPIPKDGDDPFSIRRNSSLEPQHISESMAENRLNLPPRTRRHNLLDNFLAAVLLAFVESHLFEALVQFILRLPSLPFIAAEPKPGAASSSNASLKDDGGNDKNDDEHARVILQLKNFLSTKAIILLGELLYMSNNLLQSQRCARLQTLSHLVSNAVSSATDPGLRSRATSLVSKLDQYMHIKEAQRESSAFDSDVSLVVSGASKWRRMKGKDKRLDRIETVKLKIDHKMDSEQLRWHITNTNVLNTKDWERWDWQGISDLLEGPFTNPNHVSTGLKTKFFKRLLSFLRPNTGAFPTLQRTNATLKYVRIACQLLDVLVSSDTGIEFLSGNQLLPQLAEVLRLEGLKSDLAAKRMFTAEKVLRTMAREYFTMIGTLSSSQSGINLLNHFKLFEHLSPLSQMPGREDLSHLIMTSLDYNVPGPSRILLQNGLLSNSKVIRFLATRHLRVLFRAGVSEFSVWGIKFLVKQLADTDKNVIDQALQVLDEACDDTECLEALIQRNPTTPPLDQMHLAGKEGQAGREMVQAGKDLLVRFLTRQSGFEALTATSPSFIPDQLAYWRSEGYIQYARDIENLFQEGFSRMLRRPPAHVRAEIPSDTIWMPTHFYGELASTRPGSDLFRNSGHFNEFCAIFLDENQPAVNRRGALWVIGQVARSETGLQFLLQRDVIPAIVSYAETGSNLALRGTAMFCLGLISSTALGQTRLEENGWTSPNQATGMISIPVNHKAFLSVNLTSEFGVESCSDSPLIDLVPVFPADDPRSELFRHITNLSNHITAEAAFRNLKRLYSEMVQVFSDPETFYHALLIMEGYKIKIQARRFIWNLFRKAPLHKASFVIPVQKVTRAAR